MEEISISVVAPKAGMEWWRWNAQFDQLNQDLPTSSLLISSHPLHCEIIKSAQHPKLA